ncbi:hypothetical protein HZA40_03040 [Candidatus Peregrinibacteria bacterium]|nr:hypothetical protein [Candidatus Peregrinibacteria bacterium]
MEIYHTKIAKLKGTDYREILKKAFRYYDEIRLSTKRKAYVRSAYFNKSKIFLELFWHHLFSKENRADRTRRMKFLPCSIELIRKSHVQPISKDNPNKNGELLHRFAGLSIEKELFFVQVKEDKKSGKKWFISCFPEQK